MNDGKKSHWSHVLSASELDARFTATIKIDPRFASAERRFYESCTAAQLETLAAQAWHANDGDGYQTARSIAALRDSLITRVNQE